MAVTQSASKSATPAANVSEVRFEHRPTAGRVRSGPEPSAAAGARIIPIAKVQFCNEAVPAIPGIGSQTVLIGAKQKARERNPSTVSRTVELTYEPGDQLLTVKSKDKDGTAYTTLVPFGAIKGMQVETE